MESSAVGAGPRIAVMAICLERQTYDVLSSSVTGIPGAVVVGNLDRYYGAERDVVRMLDGAQTRICVIDFDQDMEEAIRVAERLRAEPGELAVFALSASPDADRIIASMRAGCSEYLLKPLQGERIRESIARVEGQCKEKLRSQTRGKVITVLGAKGGTGVTSLALHLALHLAESGKCILVDQHPALGDASLYLGLGRHQYSFYELASNTERLDQELLRGFLLQHECGLQVLDSPEAVDSLHYVPPSSIEQTIAFLADSYPFVVVDCPPGLTESALATVAQSDQVAIVITAELPALRNAVRYLDHLNSLGYPEDSIRIVLNRHAKRSSLTDDQIEKALRRPVAVRIPNSYNEVISSINAGTPVMPGQKSEFGGAIAAWAQQLTGKTAEKSKAAAEARGGSFSPMGVLKTLLSGI